ncbi:MAG: HNH endonuclease [Aeromicrobium sp.]
MFENVAAEDLLQVVRGHDFDPHDDVMGADRIDAITACDRIVRAAQAEQAKHIAGLDTLRAGQMTLGRGDHSLSVIGELAMSRNISPGAAGTQYGFAVGLARLPKVAATFAAGRINEQAARLVVRESTGLDADQAVLLDDALDERLDGLTARMAGDLARRATIRIDAAAAREREKANRADRHVSLFPDRDGNAILHARGPAELMLAAYKALDAAARTARADGDGRTRGQVMCDELVGRLTDTTTPKTVNVEIGLVMTMSQLLDTDDNPVHMTGFGPISAALARQIIRSGGQHWIRRLYTDPIDHSITDCDQKRRRFDGKLARLITYRDDRCRQPGCDSPVRHVDHVIAFHTGGPTTLANGQGLCVRSHTLKHLPGWEVITHGRDICWTTPTGHKYTSAQSPLIEYGPRPSGRIRQ